MMHMHVIACILWFSSMLITAVDPDDIAHVQPHAEQSKQSPLARSSASWVTRVCARIENLELHYDTYTHIMASTRVMMSAAR